MSVMASMGHSVVPGAAHTVSFRVVLFPQDALLSQINSLEQEVEARRRVQV